MTMNKLKYNRMPWFVILPVLLLMIGLFFVSQINNGHKAAELQQRSAQLTREHSELNAEENLLRTQLSQIGTTTQIDSEARSADFVRKGELRFVIDNSEGQLEMYTEEEWEIMMEERALGIY